MHILSITVSVAVDDTFMDGHWKNWAACVLGNVTPAWVYVLVRNCDHIGCVTMGWDGSVGIATRYGLDGPGIETRWERDFPHPSRPALGLTQTPMQWVPRLCPGGKAAGAWRWPPNSYSAEVKERV